MLNFLSFIQILKFFDKQKSQTIKWFEIFYFTNLTISLYVIKSISRIISAKPTRFIQFTIAGFIFLRMTASMIRIKTLPPSNAGNGTRLSDSEIYGYQSDKTEKIRYTQASRLPDHRSDADRSGDIC